jgi:Transposase IS66 family/IS66 C-terminal element
VVAREQRAKLSRNNDTTKAINYCLSRWDAFTRFLDDGRLCMSNNAAERELRAVFVGRRNWTFAGSDEGGRRAAAIYTLIATAKLNDIDPQAWLADVLTRLQAHPRTHALELATSERCPRRISALSHPLKMTQPGAVTGRVPSSLMESGSCSRRCMPSLRSKATQSCPGRVRRHVRCWRKPTPHSKAHPLVTRRSLATEKAAERV